MVGYRNNQYSVPPKWRIINNKYTFPGHFTVKLTQSDTLTKYCEVFSMAFRIESIYRKEYSN